ncbi:MAG: recombination protein RecR [Armatimonadetes bacterium]|nr:recombination protein RecR [Armatimonadota bacterium]
MPSYFTRPLSRLVAELEKLPGVGPKSAQRLAFFILRMNDEEAQNLAQAIVEAKSHVQTCRVCFNYTDQDICEICRDERRDTGCICVVADARDLVAFERTNEYKGRYHVLQGVISPMDGIGPERLRIRELQQRIAQAQQDNGSGAHPVSEIIIATNPTIEGDATAMYLAGILKPLGIKVTRIAHGMPVGGDLDYADQATLIQSLEWRREI